MKYAFISFLLFLALCSNAQNWEYYFDASNVTYSIYYDDAKIFLGTEYGIAVFDTTGNNLWNHFTDCAVLSICKDQSGAYWFSLYGDGLLRYRNEVWTHFTPDDGLLNNYCISIDASGSAEIWAAHPRVQSAEPGFSRYFGGQWYNFTHLDNYYWEDAYWVLSDNNDAHWLVAKDLTGNLSFIRYRDYDYELHNQNTDSACDINCVHAAVIDNDRGLWFGGCIGHLVSFDGEQWYNHQNPVLGSRSVSGLGCDIQNNVWVAAQNALLCNSMGQWTEYSDPQKNYYINQLACDNRGAVWYGFNFNSLDSIGRKGGLACFFNGSFNYFFARTYSGLNFPFCATNDEVYVRATNGLSVLDESGWNNYNYESILQGRSVYCMEADSTGNVWMGSYGLFLLANMELTYFDELAGEPVGLVRDIRCWGNVLWVLTYTGLFQYVGNQWNYYSNSLGFSKIWPKSESECWLSTREELYSFSEAVFTNILETPGSPDIYSINAVAFSGNQIWVATGNKGIYFFNNEEWLLQNTETGLPTNNISYLFCDPATGLLWLSTNIGTFVTDGNEYVFMHPYSGDTNKGKFVFTPKAIWQSGGRYIARLGRNVSSSEILSSLNTFVCYPNPANETLYIEVNNPGYRGDINLCDAMGRIICILPYKGNRLSLPVANLTQGMYLIMAQGMPVKKILITR